MPAKKSNDREGFPSEEEIYRLAAEERAKRPYISPEDKPKRVELRSIRELDAPKRKPEYD